MTSWSGWNSAPSTADATPNFENNTAKATATKAEEDNPGDQPPKNETPQWCGLRSDQTRVARAHGASRGSCGGFNGSRCHAMPQDRGAPLRSMTLRRREKRCGAVVESARTGRKDGTFPARSVSAWDEAATRCGGGAKLGGAGRSGAAGVACAGAGIAGAGGACGGCHCGYFRR